jgi:hypothetical protein
MGLQLRNKTPKRRVKAKLRENWQLATRPNETWAMDFVHELRVLTIIDTFFFLELAGNMPVQGMGQSLDLCQEG